MDQNVFYLPDYHAILHTLSYLIWNLHAIPPVYCTFSYENKFICNKLSTTACHWIISIRNKSHYNHHYPSNKHRNLTISCFGHTDAPLDHKIWEDFSVFPGKKVWCGPQNTVCVCVCARACAHVFACVRARAHTLMQSYCFTYSLICNSRVSFFASKTSDWYCVTSRFLDVNSSSFCPVSLLKNKIQHYFLRCAIPVVCLNYNVR